ncbi:MAG: 16S rRNA (cytidine(1402)-2'-O)-methyltransferase [Chloroflexi bacterium]|nr:16S rRNA (cytidine(1402)-2'-O)-methyltransferase [Chloroflexota bacterium]
MGPVGDPLSEAAVRPDEVPHREPQSPLHDGGVLYVVGTPIGNPDDITLRALNVLKEVTLVAAEDTRSGRALLRHFGVSTPLTSFHEFTGPGKTRRLVERIERGEQVALISEAGMPGVSDPGFALIREALAAGCAVTCVPGPSAVLTALVLSGLPTHAFHYIGFLPRKAGERRRVLAELASAPDTLVCFESPHRLLRAMRDVADVLGAERPMVVTRELTKRFEEVIRGTAAEALAHFERVAPRGEFTLVIAGAGYRGQGSGV